MTTPLLYLRCIQMGMSIEDIDNLDMGFIYDMFTEQANDSLEYPEIASQEDFDNF